MDGVRKGVSYSNAVVNTDSELRKRTCHSVADFDGRDDEDRGDDHDEAGAEWHNVQAAVIRRLPSKQASFCDKTSSRSLRRSYSSATRQRRLTLQRHSRTLDPESSTDLLDADSRLVSDEEEQWKKRETIKGMTASLEYKRRVRDELKTSGRPLSGFQKWKLQRKLAWKRSKIRIQESLAYLELWRSSFKIIEGNFGNGVSSYFQFLKFLLQLNLFIMLVMFGAIIIPQLVFNPHTFSGSVSNVTQSPVSNNETVEGFNYINQSQQCSDVYRVANDKLTEDSSIVYKGLDLLQGTGWMERTILFYGVYFNKTVVWVTGEVVFHYNMPVAYLLSVVAYFFVSLVVMVTRWAAGVRLGLTQGESKMYCNKVFCGWEYGVTEQQAQLKLRSIYQELKNDLAEDKREEQQRNRTTAQKCSLYSIRIIINAFVVATWAGAAYLIYYTSVKSLDLQQEQEVMDNAVLLLLVEFLPSLTITVLNMIIPIVFQKIVIIEGFSPEIEIKLTLWRTVFLRLASLGVLVITLYNIVVDCKGEESAKVCGNCNTTGVLCWESYVGQQFYKLVILDFLVVVIVILLVEFPRKLVVKHCPNVKLIQFVGQQEFDIPKNVLDLVYGQTLCWLGGFFSPIIPAITTVKLLIFFYMKKVSLLQNCVPAERTFRASRSNSFFIAVLLIAYMLCAAIIAFCIGRIQPSQGCGPFRVYSSAEYYMFTSITDTIATWPEIPRAILSFLGTWMFLIPLLVLLGLIIYYYLAKSSGHKHMIELLHKQLAMEGKDKQFLLRAVNEVVIQGGIK